MQSSEFRDPFRLIREIDDLVGIHVGVAYVALVERPARQQRLLTVATLRTPAMVEGYEEPMAEIRELMDNLVIPGATRPPSHAVTTVVARPGLCVFGPNEGRWFDAWALSNHLRDCYTGDLILVTEHGWCDFMTYCAGTAPFVERDRPTTLRGSGPATR
jgi:hypothetical protein